MKSVFFTLPLLAAPLTACQQQAVPEGDASPAAQAANSEETAAPETPASSGTKAYSGIGESETVRFTGTEPFWGGEAGNGEALYTTPENIDGTRFAVTRFAGNNGVSFSGTIEGAAFDLMVTPGECSDGMSDRAYPFVATLTVGGEQRNGCAWTDTKSFTGPRNP